MKGVVNMGDRALENRIRKIKDLEAQKKDIDRQISSLKDEIRRDMTARREEEHRTKNFIVRFKEIICNDFDKKRFRAEHPEMYEAYLVPGRSMRLTIS